MQHFDRIPHEWLPSIYQYLPMSDLVHLELVSSFFYKSTRQWIGDHRSRRIRPFVVDQKEVETFNPILKSTYESHLIVWSIMFVRTARHDYAAMQAKKQYERRSLEQFIDSFQWDIPIRVMNEMFTSKQFHNAKVTSTPMNEQIWKHAMEQYHSALYFALRLMNATSILSGFHRFSDRQKIHALEFYTNPSQLHVADGLNALIRLSSRALSFALPSQSLLTLRFYQYILWTVWGPFGIQWIRDDKPVFNTTAVPPTVPWFQQIWLDDSLVLALPGIHESEDVKYGLPTCNVLESMFSFQTMLRRRWMLSDKLYVDVLSGSDGTYIMFEVFRKDGVMDGRLLLQRMMYTQECIMVQYHVVVLETNEYIHLQTISYDAYKGHIQEAPELMCWKYIPIHAIRCNFKIHFAPCLFKRVRDIQDRKLMEKQRATVENTLQMGLWSALGIPVSKGHMMVTPHISVVNNCIWNVFYECNFTCEQKRNV